MPLRLGIKEQEEVSRLVWSSLAVGLSCAQRIQGVDACLAVGAGPRGGVSHQNRNHFPPYRTKTLAVNDVAVIERGHQHAGVRRHLAKFCQRRTKVSLRS